MQAGAGARLRRGGTLSDGTTLSQRRTSALKTCFATPHTRTAQGHGSVKAPSHAAAPSAATPLPLHSPSGYPTPTPTPTPLPASPPAYPPSYAFNGLFPTHTAVALTLILLPVPSRTTHAGPRAQHPHHHPIFDNDTVRGTAGARTPGMTLRTTTNTRALRYTTPHRENAVRCSTRTGGLRRGGLPGSLVLQLHTQKGCTYLA